MNQIFIITIGYTHSGKSTLVRKIIGKSKNLFTVISSTPIHSFLNKNYKVFQDDKTIKGKGYWLRQKATKSIGEALIRILLEEKQSVILDSCNLPRKQRKYIINQVKKINKKIKTVLLFVKASEKEIITRLKKADKRNIKRKEKPTWIDLYYKIQKKRFDKPSEKEADYFFIYKKDNLEEIISELRKLIEI